MGRFRELLRSHHIQLALAAGASIIVLAYVSKRVLAEPMDNLAQAFPPFLAVIAEGVISKHSSSRLATTWYWVAAILLATAVIIAVYMV